jgi:hypothetical protein
MNRNNILRDDPAVARERSDADCYATNSMPAPVASYWGSCNVSL